MPQINPDWFQINPWLLIIATIIIFIFSVFVVIWSVRAHQRQVSAGREEMIGRTAVVDIALEPKGGVLIEGERWTAFSEQGRIEPEEEVIVTKVSGLKLHVARK